jgi:hypothetical protein
MPIADEVTALKARAQQGLSAISDYPAHSKELWQLFETDVTTEGRLFTYLNGTTGTTVNQNDLVILSRRYIDEYLTAFAFQRFVTIFETFCFNLMRVLLAHNPRRLGRKEVDFATVLAAPDREAIIFAVIDKELNELKYERVRGWYDYLESTIHLGCPSPDEVEGLAEIEASRDVLEHNAGIANAVYLAKAGGRARHAVGEAIELSDAYLRVSWALLRQVVEDVSAAVLARLAAP